MRELRLTRPLHLDRFLRGVRFRVGSDFTAGGTPQPWAAVVTNGYDLWDCEILGDFESHPADLGGVMRDGHPWSSVHGVAVTGRGSQLEGVSVERIPGAGLFFGPSIDCGFRYLTLSLCFNGIFGEGWHNYTPPADPGLQKLNATRIHGSHFSIGDLWGWRLTDAEMAASGLWKGYPAGFSNGRGRDHVVGNDGLVGIFHDSLFERFTISGEMKAAIKFSQATTATIRRFHAGHLMNQGTFSPPKPHPDGDPAHHVFWSQYLLVEPGTVRAQDGILDPRLQSHGYYDLGGQTVVGMNTVQGSFPGVTRLENVGIYLPDRQQTNPQVFAGIQSYLHTVQTSGCRLIQRDPQAALPGESVYPHEYCAWLEPKPGGVLVPWGGSTLDHSGLLRLVQPEKA